MKHGFVIAALLSSIGLATAQAQQRAPTAEQASEHDYLSDMPIVLSVSRLAQRMDDTPGALTILERDLIIRSGARDLVDLLRLVPGFQTTTSFETDAPVATYHGRSDDWANRIQVLIDGRSVYSSQLQGSAGVGMLTLSLDEIERVEVLRGSNSAAYGARALLGVINIVSRDVRDTQGRSFSTTQGQNQVSDAAASVGWASDSGMYRLHADTRSEAGLRGAYGASRINRLNFSGRLQLQPGSDLEIRAGQMDIEAGRGSLLPGEYGNPARMRGLGSAFLQGDWHHALDQNNDLLLSLSHTEHTQRDRFAYLDPAAGLYYGIDVKFNGDEFNDALTAQWSRLWSDTLKTATGLELRSERLVSWASFADRGEVTTTFMRAFGSAQWHVHPSLVVNASGMWERSTPSTEAFSPRLMLNWHVLPGQTLRAGVSSAFRPPSAYERYSLVQYLDRNNANPLVYVRSTGNLVPEKMLVRELGYQLNLAPWGVQADARAFEETVTDGIRMLGNPPATPGDHFNGDSWRITGMEWQWNWRRSAATQVMFTQTWAHVDVLAMVDPDMRFRMEHSMARYAASLSVLHQFGTGWDVGLTYSRSEDIALLSTSTNQWLFHPERLDLRLAHAWRLGSTRAQAALTLQNLGGPMPDGDRQFRMDPRAMLTLRLDY